MARRTWKEFQRMPTPEEVHWAFLLRQQVRLALTHPNNGVEYETDETGQKLLRLEIKIPGVVWAIVSDDDHPLFQIFAEFLLATDGELKQTRQDRGL